MAGGVILTTPRAKKPPSVNLTSRAYPSDALIHSAKLSFDRLVPAFPRRVFLRDFPASDPISLGWSAISIYLNVAEILPMGGVAGRLRKENSPMGQKYKEEARLQSFSPWSAQSDSWDGNGRAQRGRGMGMIPSFLSPPFVPICFVHFLP